MNSVSSTSTPASPTLKDVARKAGVHFTTVSLALRGNPRIPPKTRDRILRIAQRLGYKRDPVLLALTARRRNARVPRLRPRLIFLTNRPTIAAFNNTAHMRYFLEGATHQAEAMGYACDLLLVGDESIPVAEIERRLQDTGTEGIILGAFVPHRRRVELDWSRYALVKIDSRFMAPEAPLVCNDQMQVVRLALQRLHALGYRRIGMAVGRLDEETTDDLFAAGYLLEQERLGLEPIPLLHFAYLAEDADAVVRIGPWVRQHRIDAVVSNWRTVREIVTSSGLKIPHEVACACLCLSDPDPRVAGVIQHHYTVGQRAAELLALLHKSGQRGVPAAASATYVEGVWQDGESAPPRSRGV